MKLSVVIPTYNEASTIKEVLRRVKNTDIEKEVIVVDDGSSDGTQELLKDENNIDIIHNSTRNLGKGAAVRTGLKYIRGDVVIIQDADLELSPEEYPGLLRPLIEDDADVVYGCRFHNGKKQMPLLGFLANRFLAFLTNLLYGSSLKDIETGYKLFKKDIIKNICLNSRGFEWEVEITAKILRLGYKIYEVPISFNPRAKYEGKKVRWIDGVKAVYYLFKYRLISLRKIVKDEIYRKG